MESSNMEYKLLKELPDVPVGTTFKPSGAKGWYYNEEVNEEHYMRSMPFYVVEKDKNWFQEITKKAKKK